MIDGEMTSENQGSSVAHSSRIISSEKHLRLGLKINIFYLNSFLVRPSRLVSYQNHLIKRLHPSVGSRNNNNMLGPSSVQTALHLIALGPPLILQHSCPRTIGKALRDTNCIVTYNRERNFKKGAFLLNSILNAMDNVMRRN